MKVHHHHHIYTFNDTMVDTNIVTQCLFAEICVLHESKNAPEFTCSITLGGRLFHNGTIE